MAELHRRVLSVELHKAHFGEVRQPISVQFNGFQVSAVGNKLLWGKGWRVFPDFLSQYLHGLLGYEWGSKQVALPFEEQHPAVQWRTVFTMAARNATPDSDGLYTGSSGAAMCWHRLAYDFYLLEHNAHLHAKLVRRIRDPNHFQGARFEAAVAAVMLAAGYELHFENDKLPGKHAEFIAVPRSGSQRLAVEAKSRHRPGVLGFAGARESRVDTFDVFGLLCKALQKDPTEPLLVFLELNSPSMPASGEEAAFIESLEKQWIRAQELEWPEGFPAIGVVFYNDPCPWHLDELPMGMNMNAVVAALLPKTSRHSLDARPLLERICQAVGQRLNIPRDFPEGQRVRPV